MYKCFALAATLGLMAAPVVAGPCSEMIVDMEKSITAKHEGATAPPVAPSTDPSQPASAPAVSQTDTDAMQMLQQAKQADEQGKESQCMAIISKITR
jgi:hypothetical protein